jgi:hypothetical protein
MNPKSRGGDMNAFTVNVISLLAVTIGAATVGPAPPPLPSSTTASTYYVDCSASVDGNGSLSDPWNNLSGPDAFTFAPGDKLLLKRGTTCQGTLYPLGSGGKGSPIVVDAYGVGARPIIDGGYNNETVLLSNQEYWEIRNLEIVGGYQYGVLVWGDRENSTLNHIHLINLDVHDAHFVTQNILDSAEIFVNPFGVQQLLQDVLIDGVSTHDSHLGSGIFVSASGSYFQANNVCSTGATSPLGNNVTIQNSTAYNLDGSGIVLLETKNGLIQGNVVHDTGFSPVYSGTGIWHQCCLPCTIQYNESYLNHTPDIFDGGDFDIDAYNQHNILQYNYGHDSDGYCVVDIAGIGSPNVDNVIRYNVCSNNGRNPNSATVGDIWIVSSTNSLINGAQVYNNVSYWNPVVDVAAFDTGTAVYTGTNPKFFKNNIIYSTVSNLIHTTTDFELDNNIYWTVSGVSPTWLINGTNYNDFGSYQSGSGEDAHSFYTDPLLNDPTYHGDGRPTTAFTLQAGSPARGAGTNVCLGIAGCSMGKHDFFGNPLPNGSGYDIGANQAP